MSLAWRGNLRFPDARLENTVSVRMTLAAEIRNLRPRVVILPYWDARHPDHYRAAEIGFEACFLAGLKKLDEETAPHRPHKILYSSLYANVTPSFVVDITRAVRAPHGGVVLLPIAIRRIGRCLRAVSRTAKRSATGWAPSRASTAISSA